MIRRRLLPLVSCLLMLAGCQDNSTYHDEETGYKGIARIDPWLAEERFLAQYRREVEIISSWRAPTGRDAAWIIPAQLIASETFSREITNWVQNGGHLICLLDHTNPGDDWSLGNRTSELEPAFKKFTEANGFSVTWDFSPSLPTAPAATPAPAPIPGPIPAPTLLPPSAPGTSTITFHKRSYEIDAASPSKVSLNGGTPGVFASTRLGRGTISILTDARPFRNRWIDQHDNAALLKALVDDSTSFGKIVIVRGSTLSLWSMLKEKAWAALLGLAVAILFWLWKNGGRFGPLEADEAPSPLRGYDHHLEALGDFQWRLDKGASMLGPLREEILERSNRLAARLGRLNEDIFAFLGERAGIPRERAHRALAEPAPADASVFTRTVADLQAILKSLA